MSGKTETISVVAVQLGIVAAVVGIWQVAPNLIFDETLIGRPSEAVTQSLDWIRSGVLLREGLATLAVVLLGLTFGGAAGLAPGLLAGLSRPAERLLEPAINAFAAMPKSTLVPLFILWFGVSTRQEVVFFSLVVFFFFFFATAGGIRSISRSSRNMLAILGASAWQTIYILYIPASFDWLLAGARLAMPHAITTEIIASRGGLGHLVKTSAAVLNPAGVFSAVFFVVLLSVLFSGALQFVGSRLRWHI